MTKYYVAWWNLENLFDVEDSHYRPKRLKQMLRKELKGWNNKVLDKKITQLAKVISRMNGGNGPDILGVCEVENRAVVQMLVDKIKSKGRNYDVAHAEMEDKRGIDLAFVYDAKKFDLSETFSHVILKRQATRDIMQINLRTQKEKKLLVVIGNHWPSRIGGELDTEPYRITAAETLSYWNERITRIHGKETPVIIMGDFNDEPHNRAITKYALATNNTTEVLNARSPKLYNLMWGLMGQGFGTHFSGSMRMLDQFMVTRGLLSKGASFRVKENSVDIIRYPEMVKKDSYGSPLRFGRPVKEMNEKGFSDHFPISVILEEM